jgi:hypothetical protein
MLVYILADLVEHWSFKDRWLPHWRVDPSDAFSYTKEEYIGQNKDIFAANAIAVGFAKASIIAVEWETKPRL